MLKFIMVLMISLTSLVGICQETNPVKLIYEKDAFTGNEYLFTESDLLITNDGKSGFKIYPYFTKKDGKWEYSFISGKSTIGNCFENEIYFIFDDDSKFEMSNAISPLQLKSFQVDLRGKFKQELSKPIKAIKFVNGRTYDSFTKTLNDVNDKNYFINCFKSLDEYNKSQSK